MNKPRLFAWRPLTTLLLIIGFVLIIVGLVVSFMATNFKPTTEVRLGSAVYSVWVADTEAERVQGLSDVQGLDTNGGLLMDFGYDAKHGIWMKDMNFPLDIVWLDKNQKVVYLVLNAPPEKPARTIFQPKDDARYVLELPAGSVEKAGIKIDSTASFTIDV